MYVCLCRCRLQLTPKAGSVEMGCTALFHFLTAFLLSFSSLDYVYAEENGTYYLLSLPAELHGGTTEKICITLFDIKFDVSFIIVIHNEDNSWNFNKRDLYIKGECRCTEIEVPEVYLEGFYILTVWAFKEDQSILFSKTIDRVKIVNNNTLTFIQPDKYMYVPGQEVKFRLLTTNINLKSKAGMISEVAVINPFGIKMKKWSDVANMQGLMSFTFNIASQPVLGKWTIRVADGNKLTETEFEVQKYVLPRFEVTIEPPPYLLLNAPEIKIRVCANYPQGKEIHGTLRSNVCVYTSAEDGEKRPCANYTAEICGCLNFTVDSSAVGLSLRKYSLKNAVLEVFASVTDYDSKISVNSTIYNPEIKNEHVIIDLQPSEFFFKPGFVYYGKANIYNPDNSIAPGEMVEISAIDYVNDIRLSKNFTSDENGRITFTINQFDSRTEQFYLEARSINGTLNSDDDHHMMYTPIDQKHVKQWYSPGKKYLKILPIDDVQSCTENLNVKLLYTGIQREKIRVYYLVLSKSQIVANGQMSYRIDHRNAYTDDSPPNLLDTIINNLSTPDTDSTEGLSNQVPTPTSYSPKGDQILTNHTDTKPDVLVSNVVVEKEAKKNKKKRRRKKKKNRERKPRATKEHFTAELNLNLRIIPEMSPLSYLTIYLLNDDKELLSDYQEFTVKTCFKNKVGFKIPQKTLYPGEKIDFELNGSINSYCALNLVDFSTFPGWKSWITKEQVFQKLKEYHYQHANQSPLLDRYCQNVLLEQQHGIISSDYRGKRSTSVYSSKYVDAIYAFQASGLVLLTDISLESRPCAWIEPPPTYGTSESTDELWEQFYNIPEPTTDTMKIEDTFLPEERYGVLDYFPAPWLWQENEIKENKSVIINMEVPYPTNEWTGNVFCASETDGLGLLPLPVITVFQPFSVSYVLPYTCIAGERIPVSITVESNVKSCLSIQLHIEKRMISKNSSHMIDGPDLCLCNEEFITSKIYLDQLTPGSINLTVSAMVVETEYGKCTSETIEREYIGKSDVSSAIIEVLVPGFRQEIVHSEYVCPRENERGLYVYSITSKIPPAVIPGSVKTEIFVFGNMLWPGINKLDNWIQDPITNGEGNILSIAAVICVLDYLNAVGLVSHEIESTAMKMMEKCYQQQMNYIHDDGSYSIFGIDDDEGSELLTAYTIQTLVKARSYIYVDDRNLQKSIAWLRSRQQDDGCFLDKGESNKKSKYQKDDKKITTIHTVKIIISLLEFGTPQYDPIIEQGFKCLRSHEAEDLYLLSLYAYAFSLYGHDEHETDKYQRELETKSISHEGMKYWMESSRQGKNYVVKSLDVETTSYALLSLLGNEVVSSWQDLKPIVHWLSEQRKPMKGFIASRDSMIAFHAITNYALMWAQRQEVPNFEIKIFDGFDLKKTFHISEKNIFSLQTYTTNSIMNKIRVEADGYGCGILQTSLAYNMHTVTQAQSFHFHVASHHERNNCAEARIRICCRYTGTDDRTNVVIMKVKMVTGWIPQQILDPKHLKNIGVKKHEMTEDYVYLYFDEMTKTDKCVVIKVEQVLSVSALPATIFVYDYYDRHVVGHAQYKLKTRCGTKQELPVITEEEYLKSIGQARKPISLPENLRTLLKSKNKKPAISHTSVNFTVTTIAVSEKLPVTTTMKTQPKPTPEPELESVAMNRTVKDAAKVECPKCLTKVPDGYHDLFCRAYEVFKVATAKEKDILKIIADLRPHKKLAIDKHVVPVLKDICNCPALREKGRHLLLRLKDGPQFQNLDKMLFDNQIIMFPFTPSVEKKMRQLAKSCTR